MSALSGDLQRLADALSAARRILVITGAGLSADSGLPTYRGLGGLYNGRTAEGLAIESVLSASVLARDPALCWKYLAELGKACSGAAPNAGHRALVELQRRKPECWLLTQNIDGLHRAAGAFPERLLEIHGHWGDLYCLACGLPADRQPDLQTLPPRCACGGVLRPPVVLFEEALPMAPLLELREQVSRGFDVALLVGTTASFPYVLEPVVATAREGGFTAEINPQPSAQGLPLNVRLRARAAEVLPELLARMAPATL